MIKLEKKDFSWDNAKKMMAKIDTFKEKLENYKSDDIPEDVMARVMPYLSDPDFQFERMRFAEKISLRSRSHCNREQLRRTKSTAAANLAKWIINIITFNNVYKDVKPKMDSLEVAKKNKKKVLLWQIQFQCNKLITAACHVDHVERTLLL
jgi:dynein heavy chain